MQAGLTARRGRDSEAALGSEGEVVVADEGAMREPEMQAAGDVPRRGPAVTMCDACGCGMQSMGHCKWLCRRCGFLRTCIDTV